MEGIQLYVCPSQRNAATKELSSTELRALLTPLLKDYGIINFEIWLCKSKFEATLTTHKRTDALQFLANCQKIRFRSRLVLGGQQLLIKPSEKNPDGILVRVLKREEKALLLRSSSNPDTGLVQVERLRRQFKISSLACGNWEYTGPDVQYHAYFHVSVEATITFGDRFVALDYEMQDFDNGGSVQLYRMLIPYSAITTYVLDRGQEHAFVYTLTAAPKIWLTDGNSFRRTRATCIKNMPLPVSTSCHDYRFELSTPSDADHLLRLEHAHLLPQCTLSSAAVYTAGDPFEAQFAQLNLELARRKYTLNFAITFQVQKLAQNGYLPPPTVLAIIPYVFNLQNYHGAPHTVAALRRLFQQLPSAGPLIKFTELDVRAITEMLGRSLEAIVEEQSDSKTADTLTTMVTYRAEVTPAATYLAGPDPESSNRVLRKYNKFSDHFLRVTFMDEDGEKVHRDRLLGQTAILHERFKDVLHDGIKVGGRLYEFLGFSHSSLRAQTCWFLAPFFDNDKRIDADFIISKLGDFSHIQNPAKSAARIGQAFTETSSSIAIDPTIVRIVGDITRNDRVFSDGVGTCSPKVLEILQGAQKSYHRPATVFQIRYLGAKGVISLDNRLNEHILRLRPSMIKFESTDDAKIEICGIASKKLPLVLNRQLIKILEDLGIPNEVFQELQSHAIEDLRAGISSVNNAAAVLDRNNVGATTHTTWLIRKIQSLGFEMSNDMFFRDLLESVVLIQLQKLKYQSRITIKDGANFFGIMDETDTLAEGEVYCSWVDKDGRAGVVSGPVLVTRSPALHPGDIQTAKATTVAEDSPLRALHNCLVFSSKGERDLPSQLSGGDLDGDLYHVIWDQRLIPQTCKKPALYPRPRPIDIGRPITRQDVSDFFIQFMEQDELGTVATRHQVLADQLENGTLHEDCLQLAEVHSTAVDFSKSGQPVTEDDFPERSRKRLYKPDFMAPGPKVKIEERGIIFDPENLNIETPNDFRRVGEPRPDRYYESSNFLGILYRSIDESSFFADLRKRSAILKDDENVTKGVLVDLWDYVQAETSELEWEHYVEQAWRIRYAYEATVFDIIHRYSTSLSEPLGEIEVFIGSVICRNGYKNKRQKEYATGLKETYNREAAQFMAAMRQDDATDGTEKWEALRRSMACLYVGIQSPNDYKRGFAKGRRDIFAWLAAAAAMRELETYQQDKTVSVLKNIPVMLKKALGF